MPCLPAEVMLGVDTHRDTHAAVLVDLLGRLVAGETFPTKLAAPRLLGEPGIGKEIAARLLLTAGDNPTRIRNDSALAALCGASPV